MIFKIINKFLCCLHAFLVSYLATMCSNAGLIVALVFCVLHNQNSILSNLEYELLLRTISPPHSVTWYLFSLRISSVDFPEIRHYQRVMRDICLLEYYLRTWDPE